MNKTWQVVTTLLLLFALLAITTHFRLWKSFDHATLTALQNALPRSVDLPFSLLTVIGSAEITGVIFLALIFFAPPAQRLPLILMFGLASVVELLGKTYLDQPTTPHELVRYVPLFTLALSKKVTTEFSFPSGHAMRTIFIVIVLMSMISSSRLGRTRKYALYTALIVFEIVMLLSRVYLAEHWTMDIIGGTLLGTACALIALQLKIPLPRFVSRKLF